MLIMICRVCRLLPFIRLRRRAPLLLHLVLVLPSVQVLLNNLWAKG